MQVKNTAIDRLCEIMERLRDPETGCPWDRKQTYATIVPYTLEEAYEVADAIERKDFVELEGELGDLLFQVVFYAQLGREEGRFDFESIANTMSDKLVRRHPHVFSDAEYESDEALKIRWEQQKHQERISKKGTKSGSENADKTSLLDDLPKGLPALSMVQKMQKRVARHGFDWADVDGAIEKLEEEIAELKQAIHNKDETNIEEELGDVLFSCVNVARHVQYDAEAALRKSSAKFEARFRVLEQRLNSLEINLESASLEQLNEAWDYSKNHLNQDVDRR